MTETAKRSQQAEEGKTVRVRGWMFERLPSGIVGIYKEKLVADSILLGFDEWDHIIAELWMPPPDDGEENVV